MSTHVPLSIIFRYPLFHEGKFCYPTFWVMYLVPEDYDVEVTPIACAINPLVMWLRGPIRLSKLFVFFKSLCDEDKVQEFFPIDDYRAYFLFVTKSQTVLFLPIQTVVDSYGDYEFQLDDGKQYVVVSPSKIAKSETLIKAEDLSCVINNLPQKDLKLGLDHLLLHGSQTPINLLRILNHKYDFFKIMIVPDKRLNESVKKYLPDRSISFSDYLSSSKMTKRDKMILEEVVASKLGENKDKKTKLLDKNYQGPHPDNFSFESLDKQGKVIGEYCQWKRQNPQIDQDDPELVGAVFWQRYGKLCNVRVFVAFRHITGRIWDTWAFYRDLLILKQDPSTIQIMKRVNDEIRNSELTAKEDELLNQIELIITNEIHLPQQNLLQGLETSNEWAQTLTQQYYEIRYKLHLLMPLHQIAKPHHPDSYYPLGVIQVQQIPFISLPMFENK